MKEGWRFKRIDEVCQLYNGGTPKTSIVDYWGGDHLWITPAEMGKRISPIADSTARRLTDKGLNDSSARVVPAFSVIVSTRAPIGHLVINAAPMAFNQGCKGLVPNADLHHEYLFHYLSSITDVLNDLGTGATFKELSGQKLKAIKIPVPPLSEQHRIVEILDKAFADIAKAKANAEQNLRNARELFESQLNEVFSQPETLKDDFRQVQVSGLQHEQWISSDVSTLSKLNSGKITKTGGRSASLRHISPKLSLAVGMPTQHAKDGWAWVELSKVAQLESGHTPSRRHSGYWNGTIPWIGIQDARSHHGGRIYNTAQMTTELGIANSSARVLPANTVCLSRTASVGYVVIIDRPMATSQDFVNWICSPLLRPEFLKYIFLSEGRVGLHRFASGSVHQTIYFPEAKAFCVAIPEVDEQLNIVKQLDALSFETQRLALIYERKLEELEALKKSILHRAFSGEL